MPSNSQTTERPPRKPGYYWVKEIGSSSIVPVMGRLGKDGYFYWDIGCEDNEEQGMYEHDICFFSDEPITPPIQEELLAYLDSQP